GERKRVGLGRGIRQDGNSFERGARGLATRARAAAERDSGLDQETHPFSQDNFHPATSPVDPDVHPMPPLDETEAAYAPAASRMPQTARERRGRMTSPRWLHEESSPYGFVDDDGTLRQTDMGPWRGSGWRRRRRFVPSTGRPTKRQGAADPSGSPWLLQAICAIGLVAVGVYAHRVDTPWAQQVQSVYASMFKQDVTGTLWPTVARVLQEHHLALPASLPLPGAGAIHLHVPLQGRIVTDYSADHPDMVLAGSPHEPVLAAGSGTVMQVSQQPDGTMVAIDHGTLGTSFYYGLGSAAVSTGQYVTAGQVIGRLPDSGQPQLRFAMQRNGQPVNPHDDINFADVSS
ncbi:MAG: M23 family metallopeptidase, partial [Alicyclobacillus sp.]|nr:M23 family metallopeptidase [Alicyclobacillus sp.]